MNYGKLNPVDVANGTGIRVSLFVSGCSHRCPGCFNKVAWDEDYGKLYTKETEDSIMRHLDSPYIAGLSLLGGEPMETSHQHELLSLVKRAKELYPDKTIWLYSGYTLDELHHGRVASSEASAILEHVDVLVDGEFVEELKDLSLKFRGSSNQRIIDMRKTRESGKVTLLSL